MKWTIACIFSDGTKNVHTHPSRVGLERAVTNAISLEADTIVIQRVDDDGIPYNPRASVSVSSDGILIGDGIPLGKVSGRWDGDFPNNPIDYPSDFNPYR